MQALALAGVPYSDEMIAKANDDLVAQVSPDSEGAKQVLVRYPKAQVRKFDGAASPEPTELDALIAYLQMLGTLVDFTKFDEAGPNLR
jgi:cytochrome c oxidase cbb3-type subunit 2